MRIDNLEKNLIINNRELNYQGFFSLNELFSIINQSLDKQDYEKREKRNEERVTESGKTIFVELRPYKDVTEYVQFMIKIKIYLENIKDKTVDSDQIKRRLQEGKVKIIFDAWSLTDYEARWGLKPWVYFLKGLINKFLYIFPLEESFPGKLKKDTSYIYNQIKKQLSSYQNKSKQQPLTEEEIRSDVSKIIRKDKVQP